MSLANREKKIHCSFKVNEIIESSVHNKEQRQEAI